jgi:putative SOS response-associated peptidase YedK
MPVVLPKEKEAVWLARNLSRPEVEAMLRSYDERSMLAHPVTRAINRSITEPFGPEAIYECHYPELPPLQFHLSPD